MKPAKFRRYTVHMYMYKALFHVLVDVMYVYPVCSLSQWLVHQKTCPQCRIRCLPRNVLKLFIDSASPLVDEDLDSGELKVGSCKVHVVHMIE